MKVYFITAFKNEEKVIRGLIKSIEKQTEKPDYWLFMDNLSTDFSVSEIEQSIETIDYNILSFGHNTERSTGGNVAKMINHAIRLLDSKYNLKEDDLVIKIDADIQVANTDYIAFFKKFFQNYPELGIASGATFTQNLDGSRKFESEYAWHTRGPNKFYRFKCIKQIGYLKEFKGWDGLDNIFARNNGYLTCDFKEQPVQHMYETQTRSSEGGRLGGIERHILSYRNRGYPILFSLLKGIKLSRKLSMSDMMYYYKKVFEIYSNEKILLTKEERNQVRAFFFKRITGQIQSFNYEK